MEAIADEELDRRIEREVLFRSCGDRRPGFSSDEDAAMELAAEVSRTTGWKFQLTQSGGAWTATWIEDFARRCRIGTLVTASAGTRPLAICRALLKAARSPRWPLGSIRTPSAECSPSRPASDRAEPLAS